MYVCCSLHVGHLFFIDCMQNLAYGSGSLYFLLAIGGHFSSSMMWMSACSPTRSTPPATQGMNLQNGGQDGRPRPEPWEPDFEYNGEPWFEFQHWRPQEGQWHCLVCNCRATDGHVRSADHRRKCKTPWDYTHNIKILQATLPEPKFSGTLPIYLKDLDKGKLPEYPNGLGQNYHCMLCDRYVSEDHINSRQHQKKVKDGLDDATIRFWMRNAGFDPNTGQRAPCNHPTIENKSSQEYIIGILGTDICAIMVGPPNR